MTAGMLVAWLVCVIVVVYCIRAFVNWPRHSQEKFALVTGKVRDFLMLNL